MSNWAKEVIPNDDSLFMRVHVTWCRNGSVSPGAFKNHGSGMSTDWSKYTTAEDTRSRATSNPALNAVVGLNVGAVRHVPGQTVEHSPDHANQNRAHTDVLGTKDEEVRLKLRRIAMLILPWAE